MVDEETGEVIERDPVAEVEHEMNTMIPSVFPPPMVADDQQLASLVNMINNVVVGLEAALFGYEMELKQRMVEKGATVLAHEALSVKLSPPTARYDDIKADQLLKDWEAGKIDLPAAARSLIYTTKPAAPSTRVDGRVAREIEKFGGEGAERIKAMRAKPTADQYKLKIKKVEVENDK